MTRFISKLILLAALIAGSSRAAVHFVSPTGNNANSGTAAAPWLTLDFALASTKLAPGDTIQLNPGVFTLAAKTRISGTEAAPITIKGAGQGVTQISVGRLTIDKAFYIIKDLTIDRNYLLGIGAGCHHVTVDNCEFRRGGAGVLLKSDSANNALRPGFVKVKNSLFHHPSGNGMVALTGDNHVVENNVFRDGNGNDAIRVFGSNHVIRKNKFFRIIAPASPGFSTTSTTSLPIATGPVQLIVASGLKFTEHDHVKATSTANPTNFLTGFVTSYSGTTLAMNVDLIGGTGIAADWTVTLASLGNHGDIIQTFKNSYNEPTVNLLFENNYAEDCSSQWGNLENNPENNLIGNWVMRNNIFNRCRITLNCYIPDVKIYNNTFFDTKGSTSGIQSKSSGGVKGEGHRLLIYNNIFMRIDGVNTGDGAYAFNLANTGCKADYNLLTTLTDGAFTKLTNSGPHLINGGVVPTQVFVSPVTGNLKIITGAPTRGVGVHPSTVGLVTSFAAASPRSSWDIGAAVEIKPPGLRQVVSNP